MRFARMNRVLPGIFIGNYRDSKDAAQLERHRISHIIAIHDAARRLHTDKEYLCITASDTPCQNLAQYFPACNDFIHEARMKGGNVLIHCLAGMSRSCTIVIAYITSITSLNWNQALKVVRGARAVSNPNRGFQKQLQEFESTKLSDERKRLSEKFQETVGTQVEHDEENCRRLLIAYDHLLLSKAICEGKCSSPRICPTGTCRAHCISSSRFSRQRSNESSPRGSTKSLNVSEIEGSPQSPQNWERHYGCWRNHVKSGPQSTPASPILYRATTSKSHRSDSMLSISSVSSLVSLPGQISLEKDPPSLSAVDSRRNCLLSTQSCPNSPRRMPKKPGTPAQSESLGSGVSHSEVTRLLTKDKKLATLSAASHSSSTLSLPASSNATTTTTPLTNPTMTVTWRNNHPATTSPCHRFMAHNNATATAGPSRNTIRVRGITRWVMKSAYKFNFDKS